MIMHCIPLALSQCFMQLDVCLIIENCVLVGLDWASTHDAIIFSTSHVHAYPFFCFFVHFCDCVLFLSLSLSNRLRMAPKRKSNSTRNPFCSKSSSASDLPVPPLHVWFHDEKIHQDFSKNFSKHGSHLEHHVILSDFSDTPLPDVIHTRGWESLYEIPLRCPIVFIQDFYSNMNGIDAFVPQFATVLRGTHIVVTPDLISKILHVPQVAHPNYPSCQRLRTVSKDKLLSYFCETPSIWGKRQNTPCLGFAKGLKFLNMMITFVLTSLSHYNSITKPRARF